MESKIGAKDRIFGEMWVVLGCKEVICFIALKMKHTCTDNFAQQGKRIKTDKRDAV